MIPPSVPTSIWIWAAFDPILVGAALYLGFKADQAGKIFIAAIAALGASLLASAILSWIGIGWIAPLTRDGPMLLPVRSVAALVWSAGGYLVGRAMLRRRAGP